MELELGLSLSNNTQNFPILLKELDLISYVNCNSKQDYYYNGDNLSDLSSQSSSVNDDDYEDNNEFYKNNRVFNEVESSQICFTKTLPLLVWNNQPNEDHNEHNWSCNSASITLNKNESDEVVGWPPINAHRKKHNIEAHQRRRHDENIPVAEHGGCCGGSRSSLYVKVQMQGCFITRKVDLKLHHSYEDLTSTLLRMFAKGQQGMSDYKLTYQDADGDWLLAGDVPWRTFTQSVQRLKMVKRNV